MTDTGRFQYSNTTPKALRLAAELVEAGADLQQIFQGVYESMPFPKMLLLARALDRAALYEEGRVVVSYLVRSDFGEVGAVEPYSEGIIDVLRAVEGAELAALIREPPRDGTPARKISLRSSSDRIDVSAIARARAGGSSAGGRFSSDLSIDEITAFIVAAFAACRPPRADGGAGRGDSEGSRADRRDPRRQACRAVLIRRARGRAVPDRAKTGHAGTLDPFATGLLMLLSGRATTMASCFVGLPKRYLTDVDLSRRTTTGDPEGEPLNAHDAPRRSRSMPRSWASAATSSFRSLPPRR